MSEKTSKKQPKVVSKQKELLPKTRIEFEILFYRDLALKAEGPARLRAIDKLESLIEEYYNK